MKHGSMFVGVMGLAMAACAGGVADDESGRTTAALSTASTVELPFHASFHGDASDCDNAGASVTLSGTLAIDGLDARFTFSNNAKGTHTSTADTSISAIDLAAGGSFSVPKSPHRGGVGGNPYIWVQLVDDQANALSDEIFMGRCKQGLTDAEAAAFVSATIALDVHGESCSGKGGSTVTIAGTMSYPGVHARVIFRSANDKWSAEETSTDDISIVLASDVTIPKQPVRGGSGGNPLVSLQLFDSDGSPLASPTSPLRCTDL